MIEHGTSYHGVATPSLPLVDRIEWGAINAVALAHRFRPCRDAVRNTLEWVEAHPDHPVSARLLIVLEEGASIEEETNRVRGLHRRWWRDGRELERWPVIDSDVAG
jgi:hypothetical protein